MSFGVFSEERTRGVIERFGNARKAMVFVGAGVSVEAGLPTWEVLTQRLLRRAAIDGEYFGALGSDAATHALVLELVDAWVDETLRSDSLMRAASLAEELLQEELPKVLRDALYVSDLDRSKLDASDFQPGPIAREIAYLRGRFEKKSDARLKLFTTNYDDLLEVALRDEPALGERNVYPFVDPLEEEPERPLKVHHIHGYVGREGTRGEIVLTEESFLERDASYGDWRLGLVRESLQTRPCLFVGTSLTDFNLTRYLHEQSGPDRHAVVFVRQAEQIEEPQRVRRIREEAAIDRWGRKNLDVIFLDHFADVAQLIHEIAIRAGGTADGKHVDERAREFIELTQETAIKACSPEEFKEAQVAANEELGALRDELVEEMDGRGFDLSEENLSLAVWLLDPDGRSMRAWAASDRIHTDPETIQAVKLDPTSRWVAAQAACVGERVDEYRDYRDTRWSYIAAMPMFAKFGGRTPVGVATVSSLAPAGKSQLGRLPAQDQAFVERMIVEGICDWFFELAEPHLTGDAGG
jgi:hypothetical protein